MLLILRNHLIVTIERIKKKFEFKKDGHWNTLGHSIVGKELHNFFNLNF